MLPAHIQMRELHLKADVPKGRLLGRSRVPGVGSQEPAPGSAWLPALRCQTRTCVCPREADKWPGLNDQRRSKRGRNEQHRQLKGSPWLPERDPGLVIHPVSL